MNPVSTAYDLNGDGHKRDVIAGANLNDAGGGSGKSRRVFRRKSLWTAQQMFY
ncbi:MAG: hypothetical protein IPL16_07390 [Ignavibacteria bacterium]|nr:hypothetical protein [Ignavibacteria bacterium]